MKRSREVSVIIEALVREGLLNSEKTDIARRVVKESIKEIRRERYAEKVAKN